MPKPKPPAPNTKPAAPATTDVEAAIRAVVDAKRSYRAVGKEFGVSHVQVRRWVLAWRLAHPEATTVDPESVSTAHPDDDDPVTEADRAAASPWSGLTKTLAEQTAKPFEVGETEDLTDQSGLELLKQTIADQRANIRALRKAGNTEAAGRAARDMAANVNALARLEAAKPLDDGAIVFSKEEYIASEAKIEATLRLLLQGHDLRCADCGRALAIEWGTGKAEPEDPVT